MTTPDERRQGNGVPPVSVSGTEDGAGTRSPEELRAEIEQTRQDLGQSVDALSAKLDVKTRTKERIDALKVQAQLGVSQARVRAAELTADVRAPLDELPARTVVPVGVTLVGLSAVALLLWRRRRR